MKIKKHDKIKLIGVYGEEILCRVTGTGPEIIRAQLPTGTRAHIYVMRSKIMTVICSYCQKLLYHKEVSKVVDPQRNISHGICKPCSEGLQQSLNEYMAGE